MECRAFEIGPAGSLGTKEAEAIEPLSGIGCSPVLVKGTKGMFMNCISRGLRAGKTSISTEQLACSVPLYKGDVPADCRTAAQCKAARRHAGVRYGGGETQG